jgi:hypothetical protein
MSIEIKNSSNGVVNLILSGILHQPELIASQRGLAEQLAGGGKAAVLVDAREFEGWAKGGDWSNFDAQFALDPLIGKMAIVADPQWEALAAAFTGRGLRSFPIKIFAAGDFSKALAWSSEA